MLVELRIACFMVLLCVSGLGAADRITPSPRLPESTPWNLENLSQPPSFEWLDETSPVRSLFYEGEPYGGQPTQVFAYYATPGLLAGDKSLDRELPAVVLVHGGGGTAFREWAELWAKKGYAAIAMDLAGHRPIEGKNAHDPANRTRLERGGPNQSDEEKFGSVDQSPDEQWPYHAVAAVIRAHSLIRSFEEVDHERTAVTGISWGGYLTCIVAGVDSRFRAAVPVYGCGYLHENSAWLGRFAQMSENQRERWTKLWDPMQYLPGVQMPILWVNGTNDFAYPLDSYMKSYDLVEGTKQLCITVNMPHGHPQGWAPREIHLFVEHHLRGEPGLAEIGQPVIKDGRVVVPVRAAVTLKKAELHWAGGSEPINQRAWITRPAQIHGDRIEAETPPNEADMWFLTVSDERDAVVSSRIVFRSK